MSKLSHVDDEGRARMVDVGDKAESDRVAVAEGRVFMQPETLRLILANALKKGDVLTVARIAGIMGTKRTADLIPLCHPLEVNGISVELQPDEVASCLVIRAEVRTHGRTGVEMEALTAVSVAALTVYDMAKAVDRGMRITDIRLLEKRGGTHGDYVAGEPS